MRHARPRSRGPARRRLAGLAPALLVGGTPAPALAHGELPGGGFVSGALHPFMAIDHLVLLAALGLLAGRTPRDQRGPFLLGLLLGLLAGLAGGATVGLAAAPAGLVTRAILALALAAGLALALAQALPKAALAVAGSLAGVLVGLDTDAAGAAPTTAVPSAGLADVLTPALGLIAGVFLIVLDAAALAGFAARPPLPVALRVAGSWIAAAALMLLALALSGGGA